MAGPQKELFEGGLATGTLAVNARCLVRTQDGHRVVLVAGLVLCQYSVGDRMAEAHAMVSLVEQGWAEQLDVARAFACSTRTVRRFQRRFEAGGLPALARVAGYPAGRPRLPRSRERLVSRLKAAGHSNREIGRRVGVSEVAIRKLLSRLGWRAPRAEQLPLPGSSANPNLSAAVLPSAAPSAEPPPPAAAPANPNVSALEPADGCPTSFDTDPEGWLLAELRDRFGMTAEELGRRFDKSVSWVSRRLALVVDLPPEIQEQVRRGEIVAHAAMKHLVPLARANRGEAIRLAAAIGPQRPTSRQVGSLYAAYMGGDDTTRAALLADPLLFLRAQEAAARRPDAAEQGAAAVLLADLGALGGIARRGLRHLRDGLARQLAPPEREEVRRCLAQAKADALHLVASCEKEIGDAR